MAVILVTIIFALFQFSAGYLLMFLLLAGTSALLNALNLNTLEYLTAWGQDPISYLPLILGASLGVWLVGWAGANIRKQAFAKGKLFLGAVIGAILGVIVIVLTPSETGLQFLFPLIGALAGYYAASYIKINT